MGRTWEAIGALHEALGVCPQDPVATDLLARALEENVGGEESGEFGDEDMTQDLLDEAVEVKRQEMMRRGPRKVGRRGRGVGGGAGAGAGTGKARMSEGGEDSMMIMSDGEELSAIGALVESSNGRSHQPFTCCDELQLYDLKGKEELAEKLKTASEAEIKGLIDMDFLLQEQIINAIWLPSSPDWPGVQIEKELKNLHSKVRQCRQSMNRESRRKYSELYSPICFAFIEEQRDRNKQFHKKATEDIASKRKGEVLERETSIKRSKGR
ncbi:MAG: hypothetical protein Q9180_008681 [Flavoplaca navasiana]